MIVVTVGTHEQPFDRLLRAVAAIEGDEPLLVQFGTSTVPHGRGEWVDYMSFDQLAERARGARVFICHAGVGSIVLARRCGHHPVIMPRRPQLGEHVAEHQMALARRLSAARLATLVEDERSLAAAVADPPVVTPIRVARGQRRGPRALSADVRGRLEALGTARISARAA